MPRLTPVRLLLVAPSDHDSELYLQGLSQDRRYTPSVTTVDSFDSALEACQCRWPDALVLDGLPVDAGGATLLDRLQDQGMGLPPCLVLVHPGDVSTAVRAVKAGAQEVLERDSLTASTLGDRLNRLLAAPPTEPRASSPGPFTLAEVSDRVGTLVIITDTQGHIVDFSQAAEHTTMGAMDDVVLVLDRQGTILKILSTHSSNLHLPTEALLGRTPKDLFSPDQAEFFLQCIRQTLATGQPQECEYAMAIGPEERWFNARCSPLTAEAVLWVARDISARKQSEAERRLAEAALRASEQKYQQILDSIADMVFVKDPGSQLVWANKAFRDYYGMALEELQGIIDAPFNEPDYTQQYLHDDAQVFATGQTLEIAEEYVTRYDGEVRLFSTVKAPIMDHDGRVVKLVGVSRDITERKQSEAERQRIEQELQAANDLYNQVIQSIGEGLWEWNPDTDEVKASDRYWYILGDEPPPAGCGLFRQSLQPRVHPEDLPQFERAVTEHLAHRHRYDVELRVRHQQGHYIWVRSRGQATWDEAGQPLRMVGTLEDISDRKRGEVERKQAEAALRESEARWQFALEGAGDGVWDWNTETNQVFFSRQWKAMLGYTEAEVGNGLEEWDSRIHPDDKAQCYAALEAYFTGQTSTYQNEHRVRCKDGSYKWILDRGKVVEWTADDKPRRVIGTHTDISDRKRAETALRTTEKQFREAQRIAHLGNWELDLVTQGLYWSEETYRIFECDPQIFKPSHGSFLDIVHPDDRDRVDRTYRQSLENCQPYSITHRLLMADGRIKYVQEQCETLYTEAGTPILSRGTVQDITSRTEAELEREQATLALAQLNQELEHKVAERTTALQASEERWHLALKGANDGIWDWDLSTNTIFYSDRWKTMRGFSPAEIDDTPEEWLERIHPDDYDWVKAAVDDHFAGHTEFFEVEYRSRCKDGTYLWVLDRAQAQRNPAGEIIRMVGSDTDITIRKRAEAERDRLLNFLDASLSEIYVFDAVSLQFVYVNHGASQNLGYSLNTLKTMTPLDLKPDFTEAEFRQLLQPLRDNQQSTFTLETRHRRADGSYYPVEVHLQEHTYLGQPFFLAVILDITQRQQALQENRLLRERLQFLLASSPAMIYSCRTDGDYEATFISQNISDILGYTPEEFLSQPSFWKDHLHPEDAPRLFAELPNLLTHGFHQEEYRFRHAKGHYLWMHDEARLVRDEQGNPLEVVGYFADISERKQAELALQESEARLRQIFDSKVVGMLFANFEGQITDANDCFLEMVGYSRADLEAGLLRWDRMTPPEYAAFDQSGMVNLQQQGFLLPQEKEYFRQDGSRLPVLLGAALLPGSDYQTICVVVDISERKRIEDERQQAQLALQESQRFIQQIADASPNVLYLYDLQEQRNVYVNREVATILGYTPTEVQAMGSAFIQTVMHPDDQSRLAEQFARLSQAKDGEVLEFEYRMRHANGAWRWLYSWDVVFNRDAKGHVRLVIGTAQDISDRKQTERALQESQALLKLVIDSLPQTIFWKDHESRYIGCNRQLLIDAGLSSVEDVIGQTDFDLPWHSEAPRYLADDHEVMTTGQPKLNIEEPMTIVGQQHRWLRTNKVPLLNVDGQIIGVLGTYEDITDRKQIEAQLRQRNEQLALANLELSRATRLKDEFLANMSHELRTPLSSILGLTQTLQRDIYGVLTDRQRKAVSLMEQSGRHLLALINDILDLAKIESGTAELHWSEVVVEELCSDSLLFVKQQAFQKHIHLEAQIAEEIETIEADELRLKQALINLLGNAVKFTPEGGRIILQGWIDRGQTPNDLPYLVLAVIDTGIGIQPEDIEHLFQAFVQLDSSLSRHHEGTGLGLALVKRIVDMHGGTVEVKSALGQGSQFSIRLPYREKAMAPGDTTTLAATSLEDSPEASALLPEGLTRMPHILIAEDNEANLTVLVDTLQTLGYRVSIARNGDEVLRATQVTPPDLILMDIQMPGMDGLEATRQLRAQPQFRTLPIIALTALAMPGDRDRCLAAGANHYLAKPIELEDLTTTLQRFLSPEPPHPEQNR